MASQKHEFILTATDKTKAAFKSVRRGLGGITHQVLSAKTAVLGLAGVGGFGALAISSANATKQTYAYSRALGISTQQLSAWGYAAETVNIEQDKMNDILKDVSDKVGDAFNNGTGPVVDALHAINLETKDLIGLSPDEQLLKISSAMQGLSGQQQTNILESLSGDAALLQPLLANNAAELKRLKAEAIATGAAVSDLDAAKIQKTVNGFNKIKGVFGGIGNTIASGLSPYVDQLGKDFLNAAIQTHGFKDIVNKTIKFGIQGVEFFADSIWGLTAAWEGVKFALAAYSKYFWSIWAGMDRGFTDFLNKIPGVHAEYSTTIQGIAETAQQNLDSSWESLRAKLDEPLPSKAIDEWFKHAEAVANKSAHVVDKANKNKIANQKKSDAAQLALGKKTAEQQLGLNKFTAIKQAWIDAKSAVIGAYKWGARLGGPIAGGIAAGLAAKFEADQIAGLGGGGGGLGGGGGGGGGSAPVLSAPQASPTTAQQQPAQTTKRYVHVSGVDLNQLFTGEHMRDLAARVAKSLGGEVSFSP